jgi:hypothetical protein
MIIVNQIGRPPIKSIPFPSKVPDPVTDPHPLHDQAELKAERNAARAAFTEELNAEDAVVLVAPRVHGCHKPCSGNILQIYISVNLKNAEC